MLRLRQWQLLAIALLVCLAPLGCGGGGHISAGPAAEHGSAITGGENTSGGSAATSGGGIDGTSGSTGSNQSTGPNGPNRSNGPKGSNGPNQPNGPKGSNGPNQPNGPTGPASPTGSTLPTYNESTVSPTSKPTQPGSGSISLGNIGSPTVDSTHPNGEAGHKIPYFGPGSTSSSSPHCILIYNNFLPQGLTIVSVSFQVDVPGTIDAGPLQFIADNTDQNCGWLHPPYSADSSIRSPTCGGKTLPPQPHTGPPISGPGCVLRLDFTGPNSNVDRIGHFTFVLQTQCVDRTVAPCNLLTEQPTVAHPVTVRWSPSPFYVAACGGDAHGETDAIAAKGECLDDPPSGSASPTSLGASSSAASSLS